MKKIFLIFFSIFFIFNSFLIEYAQAYQKIEIFLRPAEKTEIEFNKQIKYVDSVTGANLFFETANYPNKGILRVTANEVFSSANFHVIFDDGSIMTFSAYADPTAPLAYSFNVGSNTKQTNSNQSKTVEKKEEYPFFVSSKIPEQIKPLIIGLNELEKAQKVHIKYNKPLPYGLSAYISRIKKISNMLFYEIEVKNMTWHRIKINIKMFTDYLTSSGLIVGMDLNGNYIMKPQEITYVYVVEKIK